MRPVIFIHIPKTAGTSIRDALHISKVYNIPPGMKRTEVHNYRFITFGHSYLPALQDEGLIDMRSSFKFCFVRNPWSRFVSLFFYHKHYQLLCGHPDTFKEFCYAFRDMEIPPVGLLHVNGMMQFNCQSDWITSSDGGYLVNFIGRSEMLASDMNKLTGILRIEPVKLKMLNIGEHEQYRTYYDKHTEQIVGDYYQEDIDNFGYTL